MVSYPTKSHSRKHPVYFEVHFFLPNDNRPHVMHESCYKLKRTGLSFHREDKNLTREEFMSVLADILGAYGNGIRLPDESRVRFGSAREQRQLLRTTLVRTCWVHLEPGVATIPLTLARVLEKEPKQVREVLPEA